MAGANYYRYNCAFVLFCLYTKTHRRTARYACVYFCAWRICDVMMRFVMNYVLHAVYTWSALTTIFSLFSRTFFKTKHNGDLLWHMFSVHIARCTQFDNTGIFFACVLLHIWCKLCSMHSTVVFSSTSFSTAYCSSLTNTQNYVWLPQSFHFHVQFVYYIYFSIKKCVNRTQCLTYVFMFMFFLLDF